MRTKITHEYCPVGDLIDSPHKYAAGSGRVVPWSVLGDPRPNVEACTRCADFVDSWGETPRDAETDEELVYCLFCREYGHEDHDCPSIETEEES